MLIFADSADLKDIQNLVDYGLIDGVTTNPSLIAKSGKNFYSLIKDIANICSGAISAEVTTMNCNEMVEEGRALVGLAKNIVVKIPITLDGVKACKILSSEGIKVNMTLCFSTLQALMAAKAGATYVSPFVGRLDDTGVDGISILDEICDALGEYDTQVLAASIRNYSHMQQAVNIGVDAITVPAKLIYDCLKHPLTDSGLKTFMDDWNRAAK